MKCRIPFFTPQIGGGERALVGDVLDSNYLNDGDVTERFERRLAALLEVKHVITTTSGTTALFAALVAAGVKPGDDVLVPDITFIATANAVTLAGARPVLVDVEPDSLTISPQAAEVALTPKTRAIIPVHISGRAANMNAILDLARARKLLVIEDAAEAFMSRYREGGRFLGTIGTAGCLSFSPNKLITTGQGGAVLTNDSALAERVRQLKDQGRRTRGTGGADDHPAVGFNFKFTNLQAAVGLGQLDQLGARMKRSREVLETYVRLLRNVDDFLLYGCHNCEHPLWVDAMVQERDELDRFLQEQGVEARRFWHPLHTQKPYLANDRDFPVAAARARNSIWLPSSFAMSDHDVADVCGAIKAFYGAATQMWRAAA
jgi:perosamine synthetase